MTGLALAATVGLVAGIGLSSTFKAVGRWVALRPRCRRPVLCGRWTTRRTQGIRDAATVQVLLDDDRVSRGGVVAHAWADAEGAPERADLYSQAILRMSDLPARLGGGRP